MPRILISYRRSDTQALSGRIYDKLAGYYGKQQVFIDIDNIPFGVDFREHVEHEIGNCDVLLAIMGPAWQGERRKKTGIWAENDWVKIEIETALRRKVLVVPVLTSGLKMPGARDLPASIADLSYRNAIDVDPGRDFHTHVERLINSIDLRFTTPSKPRDRVKRQRQFPNFGGFLSIVQPINALLRKIYNLIDFLTRPILNLPRPNIIATFSFVILAMAATISANIYFVTEIDAAADTMDILRTKVTLERSAFTPPTP